MLKILNNIMRLQGEYFHLNLTKYSAYRAVIKNFACIIDN